MLQNHTPQASHPSEFNSTPEPLPSRRPPRWPRLVMVSVAILLVGAGGTFWLKQRNQESVGASAAQLQAVPVKLMLLKTTNLEDSSEVVGTMDADRAIALKTEVKGRISQILVKEGDTVPAGGPVIRLEKDDLQAELLQARARLASAEAQLAELQAGNRPEDIAEAKAQLAAERVRLSNAKQGSRPEEIAQAQAKLESARSEAELAQQRVKRYDNLRAEGAISEDEFEALLQRQRSAGAAVKEAQRRLEELKKGRQSDIDELAAQVEQSQQNLRRLENGARSEDIAQAQADVAEAIAQVRVVEVKINKTEITAPIAGEIGDIPVKLGEYVEEGDVLTTITENDSLEVNLRVPIERGPQLRLGLPVEILNSQGSAIARGEISFISPDVNPNSQQVLAKASLNTGSGELLNQQFVTTKIIWHQRRGVLVPAAAISRLGGQTYVFVAEKSDNNNSGKTQLIARQKSVKLGKLQGNSYQILEGLGAGEKIITAGILQLQDGSQIQELSEK